MSTVGGLHGAGHGSSACVSTAVSLHDSSDLAALVPSWRVSVERKMEQT